MADSAPTLRPFDPLFAPIVVSWVRDRRDLFWLAPRTAHPLTAEKVVGWTRKTGTAMLLFAPGEHLPCAYGETNPMTTDPSHLWLGHLIVDPKRRRAGLGRELTLRLVEHAFEKEGARRVSLVVFPQNTSAIRCYLSCGFQLTGEEYQRFLPRGARHKLFRFELSTSGQAAERHPA